MLQEEENDGEGDYAYEDDEDDLGKSVAGTSTGTHSNNPRGINQYENCPSKNDPMLQQLLRDYHRRGVTNRNKLSQLLKAEHRITISPASVYRARIHIGLKGSGKTTRDLPEVQKRQLVLDQMAKDPMKRRGPRIVKENIARDHGVHLTRDYVEMEMRLQDPDGFAIRDPNTKSIHRTALFVLGPHYEWSGDGHDKLSAIGFPIWGIRDVWVGKWLGLWVVPNNRVKLAIAYLYLSLIYELGGMPIQMTTDCGSETTQVYGFASALREAFSPELSITELPAHQFLPSIHNTTIERGWLRLRLQWGDNIKVFWNKGAELYNYNSADDQQYGLVQWLWPKLIQQELDQLRDHFNNHVSRKDKKKKNPSGVAPNVAMALPEEWGAENCLQPVDRKLVGQLMENIGGEDIIRFVDIEYANHAQTVFDSLNTVLTLDNVWLVFQAMMPLMYPV